MGHFQKIAVVIISKLCRGGWGRTGVCTEEVIVGFAGIVLVIAFPVAGATPAASVFMIYVGYIAQLVPPEDGQAILV